MQGIFCNIQFSAIFCLPYTCLTIPRLGKRSRPMALKFLLPFLINNLMAPKLNAFSLKKHFFLSRKHENLFLRFRLWIWLHRHYSCVFFYISNMRDVQGALSLRHVSAISHAWFLRTRPINYKIFQFCMM